MKIKLLKNFLNQAVSRLQGTIADKSFSQIGLKVERDILTISAADRILAVYNKVSCETMMEGIVFVPARLFSDVVRELPESTVILEKEGSFLNILAGHKNEFSMKLPILEDVPWKDIPSFESKNFAELPADKLNYMIDQVQFCIAIESPRDYGKVGYLHRLDNNILRLVGTDAFRLSYCDIKLPELPDDFLSNSDGISLTKRALQEISRMCSEGFEKINLSISPDKNILVASATDYYIFIRISSVKYPNYLGVLPTKKQNEVKVEKSYFHTVVRRVMLASDKKNSIQLNFKDSEVLVSSRTQGSSEGKENVPIDSYSGQHCDITLNGKFLGEACSVITSDKISLQFKNDEDPFIVVPENEPLECRSTHVLVPIKES